MLAARPPVTAALGHIGLAVLVTAPIVLRPFSHLVGSPNVDVWNHAWGPWWWFAHISQGELPWQTGYLGWPAGGSLWFIDPVLALVGACLVPLFGVAGAWNAVVMSYVALTSWAGRRFALALGASAEASWIGAVGLAASAWMICEVHNGISEAFDLWPVALALAWTEEASRAPAEKAHRAWAKAGLGVGLAAVASPYLGLGAGVAALVRGLRHVRHAWLGGMVAAIVAAPPALLLRAQLHASDALIKHPEGMNVQLALHNAVDPRIFVAPFGFRSVDLSSEGFEHSMYLGLVALGLALASLRGGEAGSSGRRWWALAALACLVFALGPFLYWGDGWAHIGETYFRMPWWLIQQLAPGLAVTHPLRLAVPALAIVAGLAAVGATRLSQGPRVYGLVALVLFDGLLISGAPWPQDTADARPPAVFASIRRELGSGNEEGILNLPTDTGSTMSASRYLIWQATGHQRPIPFGPDVRASTSSLISSPAFRRLAALCPRREDEHKRLGLAGEVGRVPLDKLRWHGIRWISLHPELAPEAAPALRALITAELGPGLEVDGALLWDLGPLPEGRPSRPTR